MDGEREGVLRRKTCSMKLYRYTQKASSAVRLELKLHISSGTVAMHWEVGAAYLAEADKR